MKSILFCGKEFPTNQNYYDAFEACGAKITKQLDDINIDDYDALLLPGGGDINPKCYGQDNTDSTWIDDELDEKQLKALDLFVKNKKPVLGICRGHQLINVYFNGTLFQDIKEKKDHTQPQDYVDNENDIIAVKGSFLEQLYGEEFRSNSSHHQAIDKLGEGLEIVARCKDGVVEATKHKTLPIITVQFHPERMCLKHKKENIVDGIEIIKYFLNM